MSSAGPRQPVGDDVLSPGWTSYEHRLRYLSHEVTGLLAAGNVLKYVRRAGLKNGADDLAKARWYYAELVKLGKNLGYDAEAAVAHGTLLCLLTTEECHLLVKR